MICSKLKLEENEIFNFHRTVCELQVKIFAIWDPGIKKSELRIPGKILGNFPGIKKAPAAHTDDCHRLHYISIKLDTQPAEEKVFTWQWLHGYGVRCMDSFQEVLWWTTQRHSFRHVLW